MSRKLNFVHALMNRVMDKTEVIVISDDKDNNNNINANIIDGVMDSDDKFLKDEFLKDPVSLLLNVNV